MKLLAATNVVRMDEVEFQLATARLVAIGYQWCDGCWGKSKELWTPDGKRCVSDREMNSAGGGAILARYLDKPAVDAMGLEVLT